MADNVALNKLVNTTNVIFNMMDMCPYIMVLPMDINNSNRKKRKILTKIMNNNKMCKSTTKSNKNLSKSTNANKKQSHIDDKTSSLDSVIDRLDHKNILGCMIIIGKNNTDKSGVIPVAGGIIEFYDQYESTINCVWADTSANNNILLDSLILRLFAHAYQMAIDGKVKIKKMKIVSIYDNLAQYYPNNAYKFIINNITATKHNELLLNDIKHVDHPNNPCKCIEKSYNDSLMFYSITLARFVNVYLNSLHDLLLGHISTLSGCSNEYTNRSYKNAS